MELQDFLTQTRTEIMETIADRESDPGNPFPYEESIFTEVIMEHMSEVGMTFEPAVCHFEAKDGNARLRLSGYAISDDAEQIDLFVSLYGGVESITPVADSETKAAAEQCLRFVARCANRNLAAKMDESNDAHGLAILIQSCFQGLEQIRVYVLTDMVAKTKTFQPREVNGKAIKLEVMDIERLYRQCSAGKPRDELVINFEEVSGGALPCVYVPRDMTGYDYALTAIPGEALRFLYEKYGPRLLEANVRSFLSATGKVNQGIRNTLRDSPDRFMAYNNGIVVVADELRMGEAAGGVPGIAWLKGMQIVNGGQTTASIYFTKRKIPAVDLSRVRVPAKIIVLRPNEQDEEALISDISKFANTQNAVKLSDLSANRSFHVEVERLALSTYCPDGIGRWFYERAAGSYNTMLAREGGTPAQLRKLKEAIPASRKITKTDLAKYLNAWDQRPQQVSFGNQKNFDHFMKRFDDENDNPVPTLDVTTYRQMIAKAIVFKTVHKLVRPMFPAFQANVAAYIVSVVANRIGDRVKLDEIWGQQALSERFQEQIRIWAKEVSAVLNRTAGGRMVSEWAKRIECWEAVKNAPISVELADIPEVRTLADAA